MSHAGDRDQAIRNLLIENRIATIDELKEIAGTQSTMTIHRSLKRLDYMVSYSHRGRFYTLPDIPDFDELGVWSFQSVMFSQYGNLIETLAALVEQSEAGYRASEAEIILQADVKHALVKLVREKRVFRKKIANTFVYTSRDAGQRRRQLLMCRQNQDRHEVAPVLNLDILPDELRDAIILFYSLLDEKQRRLYAGLESAKFGHGGDRKLAALLGMNPHTVAKGRHEIFQNLVDRRRIRQEGGGRNLTEKKTLK